MREKKYWISEERLSEILGVTPRQVRDICKGAKNRDSNSEHFRRYSFIESIELYLTNIRTEKRDYLTEIKQLERDMMEHKLKVAKRIYVNSKEVENVFGDVLTLFREKLFLLPGKCSKDLLKIENIYEVEEILEKEVKEILKEFIDFSYEKAMGINEEFIDGDE